jgi:hypothetical protein
MRYRLAAVLALVALLWLPSTASPAPVRAATTCTNWTSTRIPPNQIRVLRTTGPHAGTVQTVDMMSYVKTVIAAEWPSTYPTAALQAGAVAVKQYGWYYTMHYRGGTKHGACYDVNDTSSNDQLYLPETRSAKASHIAAVEATWNTSLTKNGSFLLTGYRSGAWVECGTDADGWHMLQHSARDCALDGKTADEILNIYYGPGLAIWKPPTPPTQVFFSPAADEQLTNGSSVTASWVEVPSDGATITSRLTTLQMAKPVNGSCVTDRWLPASPPWQSDGASPQTVTGLIDGYCYRFVLKLTDSTGNTGYSKSGTVRIDALAPVVTFTSPAPDVITPLRVNSATISWTEAHASGTTVVSRKVSLQYAPQAIAGRCEGAKWATFRTATSGSPYRATALPVLNCYRLKVELTDSAGHTGSWTSGILAAPAAF